MMKTKLEFIIRLWKRVVIKLTFRACLKSHLIRLGLTQLVHKSP